MVLYSFRNINPLKVEISKFIFESGGMNNPNAIETKKFSPQRNDFKRETNKKKPSTKKNNAFPPKRQKNITNVNSKNSGKTRITENTEHQNLKEAAKAKNKNKPKTKTMRSIKNNDIIITSKFSSKILLKNKEKSGFPLISKAKNFDLKEKVKSKDKDKNEEEEPPLDQLC